VRREEQTQRPSSSPSARRPAARRRGARAQARGAAHSCRHRSSFARARAQAPGRERAQQHPAAATSPCFKRARAQVSGRKRPSAIARGAGTGGAARVPQLHRHSLLPAPAPVPARAAAAPERALQGARGRAAGGGWCPGLWAAAPPNAFTGLCAKVHMLKGALLLIAAPGLRVCNHLSLCPLKSPSGTDWTFADDGACFDRQARDAATAEP